MSQDIENTDELVQEQEDIVVESVGGVNMHKFTHLTSDTAGRKKLTGMYKEWFLDYASYVILERAVPYLEDGFKPVQRRILHAMKRMDDGRYNKVANIIGFTMQYHPHGDRSIGDALVQLGQKNLLIDCQGNWGNILTGDSAAAPRYIEARLSKFAQDVVFNPKTTEWMLSYDGRNQEPVTLPVKFPLLLAQGVEGIAVGLTSKILPHNFIELINASIKHLQGETFELYPDFPTGGMIDVSKYNDGMRGGSVKIRSKIVKIDKKTLAITEVPFGRTTSSIIESIIKANEKNKIKIKKVDDNTAENVEILIHLGGDVSADKTIDALYAFTDCEISISPNACVIIDKKPHFMPVGDILRCSVANTKSLLLRELEIRLDELNADWHQCSLEKIFIENRIYRTIEECTSWEEVLETIDRELDPYKSMLHAPVTTDDIVKLTEIRIKRISKYNTFKADEYIKGVEDEMRQTLSDIEHLNDYTIAYYKRIKDKHSKGKERKTEIRSFGTIEATRVAVANAKLYVERKEGFFGIGNSMKKDEFVCDCSDIDDVIIFTKEGKYVITRVTEKAFFAKDIIYIGVFNKNDGRTIYNIMYRSGQGGAIMTKRCAIKGITRDREYDITKGEKSSEILYMSVNNNGEAEVLKVYLKPRPRLKKLIVDFDFSTVAIKGRQSQGNLFTRYSIHKIVLKEKGISTLGGHNIWFDEDISKLNTDGRGKLLGEFEADDKIVTFTKSGSYFTSGYDVSQYFPEDVRSVEKLDVNRVYSVIYYDATQGYYYIKRFTVEVSDKLQPFVDTNDGSYVVDLSYDKFPRVEVVFGGDSAHRQEEIVDVETFISVKGFKAKGKRVTIYQTSSVSFIEPAEIEEEEVTEEDTDILQEESVTDVDNNVISEPEYIDDEPSLFDLDS